ncbi:hypothetical protein AXI76_gp095 [Pseudoalteromonas phage H101]|uniref:Uncharacterized protein n=1 Tax=Pseudoalteromonas phage H101 TaxID=1654919 RepID=A0A0H4ISZ9_9CAUD|nr:hypothetical protein AXI76_gp095 [Pseudoalteromonas phage H101]AKO60996.1 hypothetical protein [Pseudoalteromonas phage H101]
MDNEKFYTDNEHRFNEPAINNDGSLSNKLISLGYGNFIVLHCEDWATIINIDEFNGYNKTSVRVHRSLLNNEKLDSVNLNH